MTTGSSTSEKPKHSAIGGLVWKTFSITSTLVATKVATSVASKGWKLVTGRSVPVKGDYDNESTRDVVAYSALSALILTGTKVATERKAAEYYRQSTGHLPKALTETKLSRKEKRAHKKLEKAARTAGQGATQLTS